jgi:hypothetical protein
MGLLKIFLEGAAQTARATNLSKYQQEEKCSYFIYVLSKL